MRLLLACLSMIGLIAAGFPPSAHATALLERAIQRFNDQQYHQSLALFEQVLAAHPQDATAHYYLGRIYLHEKDYEQAIAHCKTAVERAPNVAAHHFCLGLSYGEKAQREPFWMQAILAPKIRHAFENVVTLDPSHREARVGLTYFYMQAPLIMGGSLAKAQVQAEQLIKLNDPRGEELLQDILKRQNKDISTN